jgi:hypothetical protein
MTHFAKAALIMTVSALTVAGQNTNAVKTERVGQKVQEALEARAASGVSGGKRTDVPKAVEKFAREVEARLIEKLDVATLLSPSCKEVAQIMRNADSLRWFGGEPWGMDPSLARQISDDEVCRFVTTRAQFHLELGVAVFSQFSMEGEDSEKTMNDAMRNALAQFWPTRKLSISEEAENLVLVDSSGRIVLPELLKTREELARYWELWKDFRSLARQRKKWVTGTLRAGVSDIKQRCNGLREVSKFAQESGISTAGPVYSTCVLVLGVFIEHPGGQPRVLYIAPLKE